MIDYEALHTLEKQYGKIEAVPEDNLLLIKLRKSAVGKNNSSNHRNHEVHANINRSDAAEIRYYWKHGVHDTKKIGKLMGHNQSWVSRRISVMGLLTGVK
ncbi:hypothetical protein [Secundilactobacillus collinoides]|uniref:Uncharacterized protein n=1 Tax=Secundilactobacillus collinoides TaxID=33960 RepID=A0A166G6G3_SECCO|nr:hypothetical protein [Secundilactobacillus collinoides]KZL37096.1 hypothetical protein TY91_13260 [Secundilactobacillus collinoides]